MAYNTGNALLSGGNVSTQNTSNMLFPAEGPRVVTAQYNWALSPDNFGLYSEDLSQVVASGGMSTPQTLYVDNTQNVWPVKIVINGTGQVIVCSALESIYYPAFFTGAPGYTIQSVPDNVFNAAGGNLRNYGFTRVTISNVPVDTIADPVYLATTISSSVSFTGNFSATTTIVMNNPNSQVLYGGQPQRNYALLAFEFFVSLNGTSTAAINSTFNLIDANSVVLYQIPVSFTLGDLTVHSFQSGPLGYVLPTGSNPSVAALSLVIPALPTGATGYQVTMVNQLSML